MAHGRVSPRRPPPASVYDAFDEDVSRVTLLPVKQCRGAARDARALFSAAPAAVCRLMRVASAAIRRALQLIGIFRGAAPSSLAVVTPRFESDCRQD